MDVKIPALALVMAVGSAMTASGQGAPTGEPTKPKRKEQKALEAIKGTLDGKIVWSSSRVNSTHDIWIMNADGTDKKALTNGPNVDWFSRFSPDGRKVLFTRSKMGWVGEMDAKYNDKWDIWVVDVDGSNERKVVENACWGTWRPDGETIVFARAGKVFTRKLGGEDEELIFDAEEAHKKGAIAQQPQMSEDGKLLAMTVRGSVRQTGIWNLEKEEWHTTGAGCQIIFLPDHPKTVIRMNEGHGRGDTEILRIEIDDNGAPVDRVKGLMIPKKLKFMDLPGRRSHEYFPEFDQDGEWMVWCATQRGHEHDIYDYEVFIWKIGTDPEEDFTRLTFHSGNDRWPDLYLGTPAPAATESAAEEKSEMESEEQEEGGSEAMDEETGPEMDEGKESEEVESEEE